MNLYGAETKLYAGESQPRIGEANPYKKWMNLYVRDAHNPFRRPANI